MASSRGEVFVRVHNQSVGGNAKVTMPLSEMRKSWLSPGNWLASSPIGIPNDATVTIAQKTGYGQYSFKWKADGYKYELRLKGRLPDRPETDFPFQWRASRTTPGESGSGGKPQRRKVAEELVGNKWIRKDIFQSAMTAQGGRAATSVQMDLLKNGHFEAKRCP